MITRQDGRQVYDALALAEVLYFCQHPLEVFCDVPWNWAHWKKVVELAKQKQWVDLKEYMDGTVDSVRITTFVSRTLGRKRRAVRRKRQKGEQDSGENHD